VNVKEASNEGLLLYMTPVENLIAVATIFEGINISPNWASIISHRVVLVRKALEQ
jgi:hypothetical protein